MVIYEKAFEIFNENDGLFVLVSGFLVNQL